MNALVVVIVGVVAVSLAAILTAALPRHARKRQQQGRALQRRRIDRAVVPWWHTRGATTALLDLCPVVLLVGVAVTSLGATAALRYAGVLLTAVAITLVTAAECSRHR